MDQQVRDWDVCVHRPTGRRCLVVAVKPDGTAACVDAGDRPFVCPAAELLTYRHPGFESAGDKGRPAVSAG